MDSTDEGLRPRPLEVAADGYKDRSAHPCPRWADVSRTGGALARWVEQAVEVLKDLDWSYRGLHDLDTVTEAALADGYTALNTVHELLCDLVSGGGYYNDEGRADARAFVDAMVRS